MSEQPTQKMPSAREQVDTTERLEELQDYSAALKTIRAARGVFLLILILSLLLHIGAYSAAHWGGVLAPLPEMEEQLATATDASTVTPDAETAKTFSNWYHSMSLLLPLTEFLGEVSCGLLTLSFLFSALVCLSGGLGGVRGNIAAFFWILVLMALLFPWGRWLGSAPNTVQIPGVYFTFDELCRLPAEFHTRLDQVLHYLRYLGYPLLALLIAFTGDRRYSRGYRLVQRHVESRMNVKGI